MIKMYVMQTCPDCEYVEKQVEGNPNFKVIDIGKHVRNLKEFLKLRDTRGRHRHTLFEGCGTGAQTAGGGSLMQYRRKRMLSK